jgi:uroporphyrinogen-III decarboxylase
VVRLVARCEAAWTGHPIARMPGNASARQILKELLQGTAPSRPLFLPIVFSHGARIENVPLRAFLTNPTKITSALRQIRSRLRSDGVTCYFDPFLEAEALGGILHWNAGDQSPLLTWPSGSMNGELPVAFQPKGSAKTNPVGVAVEVIKRLKSAMRDDCLLMASVSGPFTLAALLAQLNGNEALSLNDIPAPAIDLAASVISGIATALVEAGANVIFIREEVLPALSAEEAEDWASRLATTINIVRFYEALPVLLLTRKSSIIANRDVISRLHWDCVVCPVLDSVESDGAVKPSQFGKALFGIALPPEIFEPGERCDAASGESIRSAISNLRPAIVTTAGDVPATVDVERLNKLWEDIHSQ